ncbi:NUDIX domain-containing protein [Nioella nitratireducens]|uniref:NUDIX domain-containing protein n=1 Tax=Nioella nitratireducens TaxID=1287720 RepID=UPI0008FD8FFB|nr:NUDIX hydrolase [Nioella nitratireducens]
MQRPRLAVRGLLLIDNRLLLVNAWPDHRGGLWCAPGGGVERGASLPDNLKREFHEETGMTVAVGDPCLVNEFHDPDSGFHQVDLYFRCTLVAGTLDDTWRDPAGVVSYRRLFARADMAGLKVKPDSLADAAWGEGILYDPLEPILR